MIIWIWISAIFYDAEFYVAVFGPKLNFMKSFPFWWESIYIYIFFIDLPETRLNNFFMQPLNYQMIIVMIDPILEFHPRWHRL